MRQSVYYGESIGDLTEFAGAGGPILMLCGPAEAGGALGSLKILYGYGALGVAARGIANGGWQMSNSDAEDSPGIVFRLCGMRDFHAFAACSLGVG